MKNIAILNSVYNFGSTGRICKELADYFNSNTDRKYRAIVYYGRGKKDRKNVKFGNNLSFLFHALMARIFDSVGRHSFFSTLKLIRKLKKNRTDLIIINNIHGYYLNNNILFKYLKKNGIKVLFVFHDCWNFTGHCAHFDFEGCNKWKKQCYSCTLKKEYPSSYFFDFSRQNFNRKKRCFTSIEPNNMFIITPSLWLKTKVESSFFGNKYSIFVINNGIDTKIFNQSVDFSKTIFNSNIRKNILCVASVWNRKKGFYDILEISKMFNDDVQVLIVGKIDKKMAKNLPNNVKCIARTNDINELSLLYRSADVFFNPTYEDTFPTVNMESLSCGCPVVCYKTGGATEMLDSNMVVEKGDIHSAFERINHFLKQKPTFKIRDFSKELVYSKYLVLVDALLDNSKSNTD